ncbi:hypothetical protein OROHE_022775 [Orobanche hederae]
MCPLRFVLVFFSAVLAGYLAWRTAIASSDDEPNITTTVVPPPEDAAAAGAAEDPNSTYEKNKSSTVRLQKHEFHFLKMVRNGLWVLIDMASGRYMWRNTKQLIN